MGSKDKLPPFCAMEKFTTTERIFLNSCFNIFIKIGCVKHHSLVRVS